MNNNVTTPKRRGRKPKICQELITEVKPLKKRGRRPTCKIINTLDIQDYKNNIMDECLIVHLPITTTDIENKHIKQIITQPIVSVETENKIITNTDEFNNCSADIYKIELKLEDIYTNKSISEKNKNIVCWWCCHTFTTIPIGLPEKYYCDIFYVIGYFCSFSCCMAYNLSLNDSKIWERVSLLYYLRNKVCNTTNEICVAPPKYLLKMFGGELDIEEFRHKSTLLHQFKLVMPNVLSITKHYEETNYSDNSTYQNNFKNKKKSEDNLILKRSKPLDKSSLFNIMNIKIVNPT